MPGNKPSQAFHGFSTLPVSYASARHIIYMRAQVGASKGKGAIAWPEDRTVFMVNLPPDATEREIILLFKECGTVERVVFDSDEGWGLGGEDESSDEEEEEGEDDDDDESDDDNPRKKRKVVDDRPQPPKVVPLPAVTTRRLRRTGHTAHVIFLDASSCERALALSTPHASSSKTPIPHSRTWPTDDLAPSGLAHYAALYDALRPPLDIVLAHANTSVEIFDHEQAEKRRTLQRESKYRKGEAIVDEDGFTLVTRGGAYGKAVGGGVGVAKKKFSLARGRKEEGRKRKHKGEKEKDAFYAFQVHEKKRKALIDLKEKWEQDKAAVEKLRASRNFKPY